MDTSISNVEQWGKDQVEEFIATLPDGKNKRFLNASHSLWFRFKNYDKIQQQPYVLIKEGKAVAFVFATMSKRSFYMNLYEIVTIDGHEGKGFGSEIFWLVMGYAHNEGMQRLKMSCTPTSVTWHMRNGMVFWAVDPSGSLRADVPIFATKQEQLRWRNEALLGSPNEEGLMLDIDPSTAKKLRAESPESHGFGAKKMQKVQDAIEAVGRYWQAPLLSEIIPVETSLEEFL